jgi:NADPH:quinone reductase-like Zn-dependent oxidoreductase
MEGIFESNRVKKNGPPDVLEVTVVEKPIPKYSIPGGDIAGTVEAVAKDITQFQPGDEVFGDLSGCGWGGIAEYAAVPEKALALKPTNLSFEEAAAVPMAGVTALQSLWEKEDLE